MILGILALSDIKFSTTSLEAEGTASNFLTACIMFFLQGDLAEIGSFIPIVQIAKYRRVFVAVAIIAIT
jgi:hypothetical protein